MSSRSEEANQLILGPLRLPREITAAQPTLRLFMAYLARPATQNAIEEAASKSPLGSRATAKVVVTTTCELNRRIGIPSSPDRLRLLVTRAPELQTVWFWARRIKDDNVLPKNAIPDGEVIQACLKAYHNWVAALSRAK